MNVRIGGGPMLGNVLREGSKSKQEVFLKLNFKKRGKKKKGRLNK